MSDAAQTGDGAQTGGLQVDPALRAFVADELLPRVGLTPEWFWSTLAGLHEQFAPRAAELLARRDELQARLDAWHREHGAPADDALDEYAEFLTEIGYLLPPEEPRISVTGVDREIAEVAGPQLVVPATVPRYALNAANARWGSLFDALYGTDALPLDHELARGYDERRGAQVIAEADRLLDAYFPLEGASHADVTAYRLDDSVSRGRGQCAGRGDDGRVRAARRPGAAGRVPRRPGRTGRGAAAPARPARRADRRRRVTGSAAGTTRTSRTSCWSRRSPRSSTWRTPSPPSTARTRSAATAAGSA